MLPAGLPQSITCATDDKKQKARVSMLYSLTAQFKPAETKKKAKKLWANDKCELSSYNTVTPLYITAPKKQSGKKNAKISDQAHELSAEIGGCCVDESSITAQFYVNKCQFYPGDEVSGKIACNAKDSKKPVKKFEVKLMRWSKIKDSNTKKKAIY